MPVRTLTIFLAALTVILFAGTDQFPGLIGGAITGPSVAVIVVFTGIAGIILGTGGILTDKVCRAVFVVVATLTARAAAAGFRAGLGKVTMAGNTFIVGATDCASVFQLFGADFGQVVAVKAIFTVAKFGTGGIFIA